MNLSTLAVLLGLTIVAPHAYGLARPAAFREMLLKFPRSKRSGYVLVGISTLWFCWILKQEPIADFARFKPHMLAGFGLLGVLTCVFVRDFLAVRGIAVLSLLLAGLMLDAARGVETSWRLVVVVWAYLWIVAGIWLTVSPWRLRDWLVWATATDARIKLGCAVRLAFGLLLAGLGLTVFR